MQKKLIILNACEETNTKLFEILFKHYLKLF